MIVGQGRTASAFAVQNGVFVLPSGQTNSTAGNSNAGGYTLVSSALDSKKTLIFITVGQSLFSNANGSGAFYTPTNSLVQMLSVYDGNCYTYKEPVLGSNFNLSLCLGRLGDKLINAGTAQRVIFIPIAIDGTSSYNWASGGVLNHRITSAGKWSQFLNWPISAVLVEQGQGDGLVFSGAETPSATYQANWISAQSTLQGIGINVPWFFAVSTMNSNIPDSKIQSAQTSLVNTNLNRYAGPNTDTLTGPGNRKDGTHFTDAGLTLQAGLWQTALAAAKIGLG